MATYEREELLATLADAAPALAAPGAMMPELSHFWFDEKYVYAYDGGLGVRLALKTDLNCGVPGKTLMGLLKTSTLKQVFLDIVKDQLVLQMGKAKVKIATLSAERKAWAFPVAPKKNPNTLVLSEGLLKACKDLLFVRTSRPTQTYHNGVVVIPIDVGLELYASDTASMASVVVFDKQVTKLRAPHLPRFIIPWPFLVRVLELIEPGAKLQVLDDCLMVESGDKLVCSNLLEFPESPDFAKVLGSHDKALPMTLPPGLQPVLDRAVILAGKDEARVHLSVVDKQGLSVEGDYAQGSLDEALPIEGKRELTGGKIPFLASMISRGLSKGDKFSLSKTALAVYGENDFIYLLASHS